MNKIKLGVLLVLCVASVAVFAKEITGLKVIENVYNRPTAKDQSSDLTMTLINRRGDSRIRKIKQFLKVYANEEKKIMFFVSPSDVKNTSFMNISYNDESKPDDQWIFLPALKKVKRISSESSSDSFMGSDFTYDDLGERHPNEDTHKILRTETLQNEECFVVESIPKDKEELYSKTVTWIIKDKWIGLKKEFYDEDEELLKMLTNESYKKVSNYWVIVNSTMANVQSGHRTEMKLENLELDKGIEDGQFSERMMKRGL
ncbi:MAG: outer membrane lipoprotein-sorting protein [Candidatus Margulisbacteria bacterium]|nr:outer membrane lipoprotein-sorting protein [Candidatus Margulisiibacteriota bacterium]